MIPARLNAFLTVLVISSLTALLLLATRLPFPALAACAILFALLHFTCYCLLHEAEHGILLPGRWNNGAGILLGLFFPAPYHLLRQGHLGHHARNRTDTEAFDYYREGENKWLRYFQMYGTLTGVWWLVVALSSVFVLIWPLPRPFLPEDRPTRALVQSFNPASLPFIRLEAVFVFLFHGSLLWLGADPAGYLFFYLLAGLLWSSQQYLHHYDTPRDIVMGAHNVRTFAWLDALWLNHNWHLNHHISPQTPWNRLPLVKGPGAKSEERIPMHRAYLAMWKGPRPTTAVVPDKTEGKVIL